jgi:hypothetical protein
MISDHHTFFFFFSLIAFTYECIGQLMTIFGVMARTFSHSSWVNFFFAFRAQSFHLVLVHSSTSLVLGEKMMTNHVSHTLDRIDSLLYMLFGCPSGPMLSLFIFFKNVVACALMTSAA